MSRGEICEEGSRTEPAQVRYLQEADEVAEHQFVDVRQTQHHVDCRLWVVIVADALVVELVWDERLLQLTVPKLEQRC